MLNFLLGRLGQPHNVAVAVAVAVVVAVAAAVAAAAALLFTTVFTVVLTMAAAEAAAEAADAAAFPAAASKASKCPDKQQIKKLQHTSNLSLVPPPPAAQAQAHFSSVLVVQASGRVYLKQNLMQKLILTSKNA